jgi:hypothetical protein
LYAFSNGAGTIIPEPYTMKQTQMRETRNGFGLPPTSQTLKSHNFDGLMTTKKPKGRNFLEAKGLGMKTLSNFSLKVQFNE